MPTSTLTDIQGALLQAFPGAEIRAGIFNGPFFDPADLTFGRPPRRCGDDSTVSAGPRGAFRIPGKPASDTFYCILEPGHGPPTVVFNDKASAQAAACDLARQNPGRRFFIMQSIEAVESQRPVSITPIVART